jgi:sugar lactone lactonase YvrE
VERVDGRRPLTLVAARSRRPPTRNLVGDDTAERGAKRERMTSPVPRFLRSLGPFACAALLLGACAPHAAADDASAGTMAASFSPSGSGDVRTVAGTGLPGIGDGPAKSATFLMPSGLALAKDGTLFISDEAAQRIRSLTPDGIVHTIAGSGPILPPGLSVRGGYRDGDAAQAQFNRPEGLAVGADGAVYVADEFNACIRKVQHGTVSTVAGICGKRGTTDGPLGTGLLTDPRSVAFDNQGTMYIADFGVMVRRLANGRLTTVHMKSTGEPRILGVATSVDSNNGPVLVATSPTIFMEDHPAQATDEATNMGSYAEGNRPFGDPYWITGRNGREFFFSDIRSGTVRYLRLPAKPFVTTIFTRTIAGGTAERPIDNVGFRDGSRYDARFNAPQGIALNGSTLYVADSGNRRIRSVALPPIRLSETGIGTGVVPDANHYEIAYVGASWAFWDSLGDDSICARIEKYANDSHKFSKPVRCHAIRIDAAGLPQMEDYIKNVLADERFDAVVMNMTPGAAYAIFPNSAPPSPIEAAVQLRKHMESILTALKPSHAKLGIAWTFEPEDVSDTENLYERQLNLSRRGFPGDLADFRKEFALAFDGLKALPIAQYDEYHDIIAHSASADPAPFYGTDDSHMDARGGDFLAQHVARMLGGS